MISGVVPVALTPMDIGTGPDFVGLDKLVDWYLNAGIGALFAVCQSSEMQQLSVNERIDLSRSIVERAAGRVPIIASGHVSDELDAQKAELTAMAKTGIDALVLVTNRLDPDYAGFTTFRSNLTALLSSLPSELPLGLYECPSPYRRLVSDDELKLCRDTGRFVVLKDVSCDLETVKRRLLIVEGTSFAIINANAAIAHQAMLAGSQGFAGIFSNFHPDLYAWLYANKDLSDPLVDELVTFLALAANAEPFGYPVLAKLYHQRLGTFTSAASRAISYDVRERHWGIDDILDHIDEGTERFRERIAAFEGRRAA